ncbi:MAG: hypothetical protein E7035_07100 [Verrucomicrobiaceae bacterium]|nr:hypothetical protein [Verrucomicrobiaceae bacterium]
MDNNIIPYNHDGKKAVTSSINNAGDSNQFELPLYHVTKNPIEICDAIIHKSIADVGIRATIVCFQAKAQLIKSRILLAYFRNDPKNLEIKYDIFISDFCSGQLFCTRRTYEQTRNVVCFIDHIDDNNLKNKLMLSSVSCVRHLVQLQELPEFEVKLSQFFEDKQPTELEIKDFVFTAKNKDHGTRAMSKKKVKSKTVIRTLTWNASKQSKGHQRSNLKIILEYLKTISEIKTETLANIEDLISSLVQKKEAK